jgi:hypothetical protein
MATVRVPEADLAGATFFGAADWIFFAGAAEAALAFAAGAFVAAPDFGFTVCLDVFWALAVTFSGTALRTPGFAADLGLTGAFFF